MTKKYVSESPSGRYMGKISCEVPGIHIKMDFIRYS